MVCNYTNVTIRCGWFTHCCPDEVGCCLSVWTVIWTILTLLAGVIFFALLVYWACRKSGYRDHRGVVGTRPTMHHRTRCRARAQDQDPEQAERVIRTCEFKDKRKKFHIHDLPHKSCMEGFPTKPPKKLEAEVDDEDEAPTSTKDETPRTRHEASCLAHSEGSSVQTQPGDALCLAGTTAWRAPVKQGGEVLDLDNSARVAVSHIQLRQGIKKECQCGVGMIRVWSDAEGLGGGPFISVQGINPSH